MKRFETVRSTVLPLPVNDVDTDQIIPAQYLTSTSRDGYGANLFRRLRDEDPSFPLLQERYHGARILLVGSNFGCGSSREHAVWALLGAGFSVVIGKSFADIFSGNSAKNGLLLVTLPEKVVDSLFEESAQRGLELEVNLEVQTVKESDGRSFEFSYDPFRKHCLLNGLEDIDYILAHEQAIKQYFAAHHYAG